MTNEKQVKKHYTYTLPNHQVVEIDYVGFWSYSKELNHRVDHWEFHGEATSETGYRSHFVILEPDQVFDPFEVAKEIIADITGIKEGWQGQLSLI